jgi:hypothetical protein
MATVNKDFKIKNGLVVEGTTATVNGFDILTKKQADQDYVINLIGGTATSNNTPNTVVKRDGAGSFAANVITASVFNGEVYGNASTATALQNSRMISLTGDVSGAVFFDGSANAQITTTIDASFATDQEVTDAVAQGVSDAAADATTKANSAYDNAVSMANTLALYAQGNAYSYADGLAVNYDAAGSAANALANANSYTDTAVNGLSSVYDALGSADTAYNNAIAYAEGYTDNAVAALVDGAPALLDTLNELAEALQDNPNVISTIQDVAASKQDALTAGDNIDITGNTISVTGLDTDDVSEGSNLYFSNARAVSANTGLWDTIGAAANALADAEDYADGLAVNYDAVGSAANALADANSYTDNAIANIDLVFNTDEISEGATNLYFTNERAKTSAAEALTNAQLTNITITGGGTLVDPLVITAENGVEDSTTDDLEEGEDNLYFTDTRAVQAVEGISANFFSVTLNEVAKQVAATLEAATAGIQVAHTFRHAEFRSAEYLVKVAYGTHTEISKVLLTLDTSNNIAITEYGIVGTNGSASTISAGISGTEVQLLVTTTNNDSTVTVIGTLLV